MSWFNYYGLAIVVVILIPNLLSAILDKSSFENKVKSKVILIIEGIGRFGCMGFMIFNIPYTYFGFWFEHALVAYLVVNGVLLLIYLLGWILFRKGRNTAKILWLSVTPMLIFLFSGVILSSIPLLIFSVLFGIAHITISYKNHS